EVVAEIHLEDASRVEQPAGVLRQAENGRAAAGLVGPDALEHAHALVQAVREDVDVGLATGHELAVHPDEAVAVRHRHVGIPFMRAPASHGGILSAGGRRPGAYRTRGDRPYR